MLYNFPEESPEELLAKEKLQNEKEALRAKRVETHGYRRREVSLPSFFINWCIIHEYLQCDIKKWKWPSSSREVVDLEPLPTNFLPSLKPYKPLIFYDPVLKQNIRRVVGYREILKKREYIDCLKDIESHSVDHHHDEGHLRNAIHAKKESSVINIGLDEEVNASGEHTDLNPDKNDNFATFHQVFQLARGGGKDDKKKDDDKDKKDDKKKDDDKDKKDDKKGGGKDDKKDGGKDGKKDGGKDNKKDGGKDDKKDGGKDDKKKGGKDDKKKEGKDDKKKESKDDKKKEGKDDKKDGGKDDAKKGGKIDEMYKKGLAMVRKTEAQTKADAMKARKLRQEAAREKRDNLQQVFKYHQQIRFPAARERDAEWLVLSDTDEKETALTNATPLAKKELTAWMQPGINFESQHLVRTLRPFTWLSRISGRCFFGYNVDYELKRMAFTSQKIDIFFIYFFLTSLANAIIFCIIVASVISIQVESAKTPTTGVTGRNPKEVTAEKYAKANRALEQLELSKYDIPLYVTMVNLSLVTFWSILVIYKDQKLIVNYFNAWLKALAEMDTSGCLGIRNKIYLFYAQFLLYVAVVSGMFYYDYPEQIRDTASLIAQLLLRPLVKFTKFRNIRIRTNEELVRWECFGVCLQIYWTFCAGVIKLLMQIFALLLKNSSEMWNFKFALTYNQLASRNNRGHMIRLGLNHSLSKLFVHHRILTVLLRNFGEVFSIPIMIYMVCEMGVVTLTMVRLFFYQPNTPEDFGGTDHISIKTELTNDTFSEIRINYYHSPSEVYMIYFMLMTQLVIQYTDTTEILSRAGNAFFTGYEFVRRCGTILCKNSHQRRLIQSLEWSFSSTDPSVLSANSYYAIDRSTILSGWAAVLGFFSLIIQLQVERKYTQIYFLEKEDCDKLFEYKSTLEDTSREEGAGLQ